jgi:probable addiction module antidote protein
MTRKTRRWDAADTLETKEDIAAYLDAVLEDGDPDLLKAALGDIAHAKGMTEIAEAAGLGRANLYKALSPDGNPEFATVARSEGPRLEALGRRLTKVTKSTLTQSFNLLSPLLPTNTMR